MDDTQAEAVVAAMAALAVSVRDDGLPEIELAAREVLAVAGGDPVAALVVAAALIRIDEPVDRWWQRGLDGLALAPAAPDDEPARKRAAIAECGTRSGFRAHKRRDEDPCGPCAEVERAYNTERTRAARARRRAAEAAAA